MTADELLNRIRQGWPPVICDVRSGMEFASGHIPGALHVPLPHILTGRAGLPEDRGEALIITCEHGPRAHLARKFLAWRGYGNLELLEGHMNNWRRRGLPIQEAKRS